MAVGVVVNKDGPAFHPQNPTQASTLVKAVSFSSGTSSAGSHSLDALANLILTHPILLF